MKDFLFLFRAENGGMPASSPEEMQALTKKWMDWIGSIAAQNKLTDRGNRLEPAGKILGANNVVTDGPFSEIKEFISGYTIVKAASLDEAVELANGCPILDSGGKVEIREISVM